MKTDKNGFEQAGFSLVDGRMAENDHEIVIPRHLKTNGRLDYKVGDEITLNIGVRRETAEGSQPDSADTESAITSTKAILGQSTPYMNEEEQLTGTKPKKYKVVGIIERPSYGFENYSACGYTFITYSDENSIADDAPYGMSVFTRYTKKGLRNRYAVTAAILGMDEHIFEIMNGSSTDSNITDAEYDEYFSQLQKAKYIFYENGNLVKYESLFPIDSTIGVILKIAAVVALIIILASVYCIKNSFDISITEKIRQYGMLSSVGATKHQIRKSVKAEAAMLGLAGLPLGIIGGLFATFILIKVVNIFLSGMLLVNMIFHVSIMALLAALLLGVVTIYFSATGYRRCRKIRSSHTVFF